MMESDHLIGRLILHYRILQRLGQGGMGVVYKAEDTRLERFATLKFLPPELAHDAQMRDRFFREARAASALNHPNICTIYEVGDENGQIFIAMEFLDGLTLREQVEQGPLPLDRLLDIAIQVLDGLEAAHNEGIIHRDIKLGNIFLTKTGRAKILDFGLAKKGVAAPISDEGPEDERSRRERQLTSGLAALGTAAYMSPEQALGRPLDARTDLFSFGIVLYEMATGKAPFQGDTTGVLLLSIVQERPEFVRTLNPDMPEGLQQIIDKCLQKQREERYQSARDIRNDLQLLRSGSIPQSIPPQKAARHPPVTEKTTALPPPSSASPAPALPLTQQNWFRRFRNVALALVALLIIAGLTAMNLLRVRRAQALKPQDDVVLADFTNTTGDAVFDDSLKQAVRLDLDQSPYFQILPDNRASDFLQLMNRPANQRLTFELARELCLRSNSKALIQGSITTAQNGYLLNLTAVACQNGNTITEVSTTASGKPQVLTALNHADRELRRKLGESLPSIKALSLPLEDATTSSLEALQAYSQGLRAYQVNSVAEAIPLLQRAIQLDPNFAQAYETLGGVYFSSAETALGELNFTKAYDLRNRVSARERFRITTTYLRSVTGQDALVVESCRDWLRFYPDDAAAYRSLGSVYLSMAQLEKSVEANRQAILLDPERIAPYINVMLAYKNMDRYDEAKAIFNMARSRNLDNDPLRIARFSIAFLENDRATMQEQIQWATGRKGSEDWLLEDWADAESYYGRYTKARGISAKAQAAARRDDLQTRFLEHLARVSLREAEVGNSAYARQLATQVMPNTAALYIRIGTALAFAKAGDTTRAQILADRIDHQKPDHTLVQSYFLPIIRANIELQNHHPEKAVSILAATLPLDLASNYLDGMQPAYTRGLAYLQLKDGAKAAAEFQKLIDHPGLVDMIVTGALARLQLARAEVLTGNRDAARRHYQDFFALWKDADPNLPILQQAKSEYAHLKR